MPSGDEVKSRLCNSGYLQGEEEEEGCDKADEGVRKQDRNESEQVKADGGMERR